MTEYAKTIAGLKTAMCMLDYPPHSLGEALDVTKSVMREACARLEEAERDTKDFHNVLRAALMEPNAVDLVLRLTTYVIKARE